MCGIIGYSGHRPAVGVIIEGLKRLEYRGYDSSGVAYADRGELRVVRAEGKLANLETKLGLYPGHTATSGMGHTRWATHGLPVERNAHPHRDQANTVALVHNGIIENYQELRAELQGLGIAFASETDTEVLAQLIGLYLAETGGLDLAVSKALSRVEGSYAIVVMSLAHPGLLFAARKSSPLVLGLGAGENFAASEDDRAAVETLRAKNASESWIFGATPKFDTDAMDPDAPIRHPERGEESISE